MSRDLSCFIGDEYYEPLYFSGISGRQNMAAGAALMPTGDYRALQNRECRGLISSFYRFTFMYIGYTVARTIRYVFYTRNICIRRLI